MLKQADGKSNRHAFLLSYLTVPTLAKESFTLLALLHTRANARLEDWAAFDNDQLTVNWDCPLLDVEFNPGCVMLYGPNYGQLKKWNKESVHRGDYLGFPRAQILLEAQATLMATLRRILEKAVERIPQSPSNNLDPFVDFISAGRLTSQTSTAWSSYVQQPSSDPPRLNFRAQISDVQARIQNIGDQLWLLQTEPVYLRRYLRVIGQTSATHAFKSSDWPTKLLLLEIKTLLEAYWFWQGVLIELEHANGIYDRFRDAIGQGSALPTQVESALGALEALMGQGIDWRAKQLQCLFMDRPVFSGMYDEVNDEATKSRITELKEVSGRPEPATEYKTHRLWWCLGNLLGRYDMTGRLPYPLLFGVLDDHLGAAGASEREKMDEVLYERFSDFATMLKLFEALRLHRPTYARRDSEDYKSTEDRLGWRRMRLANRTHSSPRSVLRTLQTLQNTKPPAGGKGVKWLQVFDADHAALQAFWRSLLVDYRGWHTRCKFSTEDVTYYLQALQFWESEDYRKQLELKRQSVLSAIEKRIDVGDDIAFLPLPISAPVVSSSITHETKQKIKTRGAQPVGELREAKNHTATNDLLMRIEVPKRALSMFRSMFPDTLQERSAEIALDSFVLSMTDAGFSSRNGGGSIVIFEENAGPGKIIFHRPHPSSKIDPIMFQGMGRGMNKHFGWNRETFAVAAKVGKAG